MLVPSYSVVVSTRVICEVKLKMATVVRVWACEINWVLIHNICTAVPPKIVAMTASRRMTGVGNDVSVPNLDRAWCHCIPN